MGEWPKWMGVCVRTGMCNDRCTCDEDKGEHPERDVEVVPADLARELYDLLEKAHRGLASTHYDEIEAALARYEREVGE